MLYQLAMYALSTPSRSAAILYPTTCQVASEQRVEVRDSASGSRQALVALRPVHVGYLATLIDPPAPAAAGSPRVPAPPPALGLAQAAGAAPIRRQRQQYAHYLAFSQRG